MGKQQFTIVNDIPSSQQAMKLKSLRQSRYIDKDEHEGPCMLQHSVGDVGDLDVQSNTLLVAER